MRRALRLKCRCTRFSHLLILLDGAGAHTDGTHDITVAPQVCRRTLPRRAEAEYEAGIFPDQAARLERFASELAQAVRGPEAKQESERAEKEKRDANSLKIYAQNQRSEIDGTSATVAEDVRMHISRSL